MSNETNQTRVDNGTGKCIIPDELTKLRHKRHMQRKAYHQLQMAHERLFASFRDLGARNRALVEMVENKDRSNPHKIALSLACSKLSFWRLTSLILAVVIVGAIILRSFTNV